MERNHINSPGSRARRPTDSISFHVTLVDTDGIQEVRVCFVCHLSSMSAESCVL